MGWIENWMKGQTLRVVISGAMCIWRPVTRGEPRGSVLSPLLFKVFIHDLNDGAESILNNLAEDTNLGGVPDRPEGRAANLDRPEK